MANIYGVCPKGAASHKGYRDVVQQTDPMISGQLRSSISGAQTLQLTFGYLQAWHNSFRVEQVLCRRNSHVQAKQEQYSGSPKLDEAPSLEAQTIAAICTPGVRKISHTPQQQGQVAGKEKGRTANPTLWMNSYLNHEVNQYSPVLDDARKPDLAYGDFRSATLLYEKNQYLAALQDSLPSLRGGVNRLRTDNIGTQNYTETSGEVGCISLVDVVQLSTYKKSVGQPSGDSLGFLRCRRLISPSIAVTMKPEVLSPTSFTDSIASTISWGTLAFNDCDFALTVPVAIGSLVHGRWATVYTEINQFKYLTWATPLNKVDHTLVVSGYQNGNAPECGNTTEASIHNVTGDNTMELSHSTQTRPKFVYLFLGTPNEFPDSTPTVLRAEADSEVDARSKFPRWTLTFAAQIRTAAPCRLQIFSTDDGFMWVYEQRQATPEVAHA